VHKDIKGSSAAARAQGHHWGQGDTITGKKLSDILEIWKNVLSLQVEFIFTNKNHDI
jgi:hypothetical protein